MAIALLANTIATGAALVALILTFGPISGAHFNPPCPSRTRRKVDSLVATGAYVVGQVVGAFVGVAVADAMFGEPLFACGTCEGRFPQMLSETVATFGLLSVIWGVRSRPDAVPSPWRLYHCRVLVHGLHVVCESGGDAGSGGDRDLRRHSAGRRSGFRLGQPFGAAAATALFRWLVPALPAMRGITSSCRMTASEARRGA